MLSCPFAKVHLLSADTSEATEKLAIASNFDKVQNFILCELSLKKTIFFFSNQNFKQK